jgi:acetyl esterase/lipase
LIAPDQDRISIIEVTEIGALGRTAGSALRRVCAPSQGYVARLQQSSKHVKLVAFPDTWHAFDYPNVPTTPTLVKNAYVPLCTLVEEPLGTMMNTQTKKPFTYNDSCVGRDPHVAYSAASTRATQDAVKALLREVFRLN